MRETYTEKLMFSVIMSEPTSVGRGALHILADQEADRLSVMGWGSREEWGAGYNP